MGLMTALLDFFLPLQQPSLRWNFEVLAGVLEALDHLLQERTFASQPKYQLHCIV
jgi:hypothetical protein